MRTRDLPEEERLKYNQYHRNYYHRKKAEKKAELERLVKQNLKNEIKIEGGNE